ERERLSLMEVDAGRWRRTEVFAAGHLSDAVVRLYERYAERLPEGPARGRAVATARSVAALSGPVELDRFAGAFAPAMESVDHRPLSLWSACGAEEALAHWRAWLQLVDVTLRVDDVLVLPPDALLSRATRFRT